MTASLEKTVLFLLLVSALLLSSTTPASVRMIRFFFSFFSLARSLARS